MNVTMFGQYGTKSVALTSHIFSWSDSFQCIFANHQSPSNGVKSCARGIGVAGAVIAPFFGGGGVVIGQLPAQLCTLLSYPCHWD